MVRQAGHRTLSVLRLGDECLEAAPFRSTITSLAQARARAWRTRARSAAHARIQDDGSRDPQAGARSYRVAFRHPLLPRPARAQTRCCGDIIRVLIVINGSDHRIIAWSAVAMTASRARCAIWSRPSGAASAARGRRTRSNDWPTVAEPPSPTRRPGRRSV